MRHYIIATHGRFASGIMDSVRMIYGDMERTELLCGYVEGMTDEVIALEIQRLLDAIPREEEIVVVADMLGGSICNHFCRQLGRENLYLISGLSLPLLFHLFLNEGQPVETAIAEAIEAAKNGTAFVNLLVEHSMASDEF